MLLDNGAQMRPPVQPTITPAQRQSVVVVGGGFAGLNLIQHLRDAPVNIVLVDRCNHHLFQPLLYQVATAALAPGSHQPANGAKWPEEGREWCGERWRRRVLASHVSCASIAVDFGVME
jgi:NADPH-dependent 2,4-dienoyl-CoA reductase/sulfur reductase-like enzyme